MYRIAILGAKGGTGKSTIAFGLSKVLANEFSVVLLDLSSSRTISNIMGIKGCLTVGHDFIAEDGKLKIVSFHLPFIQLNESPNLKDIYDEIIDEAEFLILDYGLPLYDRVASYELELFYRTRSDSSHIIAVSPPHDFIIKSTEKMISSYMMILKETSQVDSGLLDFFTVNMIRQEDMNKEIKIGVSPIYGIVKIPFLRNLSFNGFWNADIPPQVVDMASKLAQSIRLERTS